MTPIRVMIVEDSPTLRVLLTSIISSDPRLEVVATAASAEQALELLSSSHPDLITMDIRLPGMNGFEATSVIMARQPTPVVVISASVNAEDLNITMNAMRAGALCVIEKPRGQLSSDYHTVAERLCEQLVSMSQVRVVRQRIPRTVDFPRSRPGPVEPLKTAKMVNDGGISIVGLAASTGGPAALVTLLRSLPSDFRVPILLVQHMGGAFMAGFVDWLGRTVPQRVEAATPGQVPVAGCVYVAPADQHLEMGSRSLRLSQAPPILSLRPSANALFESLARNQGGAALGVLLTGMGEDGASGLLRMRQAGSITLAEDASTAVVFGMPAAARALGGVCEMLPLPQLANRLRVLVKGEVRA